MNNVELAVHFLLQLAVILFVCRIVGLIAARLGQPQVVAEMIAGVCLGPSLWGAIPGIREWQGALFPWDPSQQTRDTQSYLFPASQLGLALYMFVVGMEFRVEIIRQSWKSSVMVSIAGMLAPFILGGLLGWFFHRHTMLFPPQTTPLEAILFLGAAMCITAFPMLARIIHFKGLAGTRMGTVAIGAGAIDDAAAWCLLAVVLASFDRQPASALLNVGGGLLFASATVLVVRPLLWRLQAWLIVQDRLTDAGAVVGLCCMALGAFTTDAIGLHAVFGAFLMGTAIPRGTFSRDLTQLIQPLTVLLLLPLFFVFSGLNTQIGLLNSVHLWLMCGLVVAAAFLGKGVACWLTAQATGLPRHEAMGLGVLMNARGLMELIIINIGLQRGVITAELFATLVIMAVVSTLLASPLFERLMRRPSRSAAVVDSEPAFTGKRS